MSVVSDNLATLRAYPLDMPGSKALDNVAKLRLLDPDAVAASARRVIFDAVPGASESFQRLTPRSMVGATIGTS